MTGFLLDTNVVSETAKRRPEPRVIGWLSRQAPEDLFVTSVSIGELVRGARRIREPVTARRYEDWIQRSVMPQFSTRVLPFDTRAAFLWGGMMAARDRAGRRMPLMDAQIAAIATLHTLTLVTRNVRDFGGLEVPVLNPWDA